MALGLVMSGRLKESIQKAMRPNVITSIYLHNPNKRLFNKLVVWLKEHDFVFLSSKQLVEVLKKRMPCPKGAVWISLDDGWRDNLKNVVPVAQKYEIPLTIFIQTGAVEEGSFWWRKVQSNPELVPSEYRDANIIRRQPEQIRRQIIKKLDNAGIAFTREAMTIDELKEITSIPFITIGAHTVSHPIFPNCEEEDIYYELGESKRILEEWTGEIIAYFAYPNGAFSVKDREMLEQHGYELAATTEESSANINNDPFLFPRRAVMDDGSFTENLCHAFGIWTPFINILKRVV